MPNLRSGAPEHLKAARLSPAFRCARYANVKEISAELATAAKSRWTKKIIRNHLTITGIFLLFLLGLELFFWWIRGSHSAQLPKFALIFLAIPVFGLAFSRDLSANYLIWPIYALRFALEAYGQQLKWRRYVHLTVVILLVAIALILISQAFFAIKAL